MRKKSLLFLAILTCQYCIAYDIFARKKINEYCLATALGGASITTACMGLASSLHLSIALRMMKLKQIVSKNPNVPEKLQAEIKELTNLASRNVRYHGLRMATGIALSACTGYYSYTFFKKAYHNK